MPISATFAADFTLFTTAVAAAETKLVSFDDNAKKVAGSLSAMERSISGVAIQQAATIAAEAVERLGGASKLTYAELQRLGSTAQEAVDKMKALGQAVPANIQNLADRARGASEEMLRLANATKQNETATTDWSGALSTAQGVLGAFGIQAGLAAVVNFGKAILDDADALMKMHDKTGISVEGLQALRIAGDDAGVSLEDMTSAVTMLQKRLGGDDQSALKALQDLGINLEQFKQLDGAEQMSEISDAVRGLHDPLRVATDLSGLFGKAWAEQLPALKRGFQELKDGTGQMSTFAVKYWDDLGDHIQATKRSWTAAIGEMVATVLDNSLTGGLLALNGQLAKIKEIAEKAAPALGGLVPPGLPKDLDDITEKSDKWAKSLKPAAEAADKYAAAWEDLNSIGTSYADTIAGLNPKIADQVTYYVQAGAAVGTLAAAFPELTASQLKALEEGAKASAKFREEFDKNQVAIEEDTKKQTAKINETILAGLNQIQKAQADAADAAAKATLSSTDYQIRKVNEAAAAQIAAFKGTADQAATYAQLVMAAAARQADGIIASASTALDVVAKKGMDAIAVLNLAARQAQAGMAVDVVGNAATAGINSGIGMQAPIYVAPPIFARAAGGPVSSGQPYLVGERGPELFVPTASGAIAANGRSAGVVQNIVIHVNGTAADVARQVSDEIMRQAMRGQQFGAS